MAYSGLGQSAFTNANALTNPDGGRMAPPVNGNPISPIGTTQTPALGTGRRATTGTTPVAPPGLGGQAIDNLSGQQTHPSTLLGTIPTGTGSARNTAGGLPATNGTNARPGDVQNFNGVNMRYTGTGWTSTGVSQQTSGPQGSAPINLPGSGGFEMSNVPGMSSPTLAPSFSTAMQSALNAAQSPFITNNIASGATSASQEAQYIMDKAQQWADLNPDLAAANPNWRADAQAISNQYLSWSGNGAAQYSSTNGGLIPGLGPNAGVNSNPMLGQTPGGGGVQTPVSQPLSTGGGNITPQAPQTPPTTQPPVREGSYLPYQLPPGSEMYNWIQSILGGGQNPYGVTQNPLGYTQWEQPGGQAQSGGDSQTALILTMLMGLMGNQGGTRRNFWQ